MTTFNHFPISPTRYAIAAQYDIMRNKIADECNIFYGKQDKVGWRFVVQNDGYRVCGPTYRTKAELLADMPRYAGTWAKEWR